MNNNLKIDLINNLLNNRKLYQIISQTGKAYITQKTTKKLYFLEKYLSDFTDFKFPLYFNVSTKLIDRFGWHTYNHDFYIKNLKELFKFFFRDDTLYSNSIYRVLKQISNTYYSQISQTDIIQKIKNKLLKTNNFKQKIEIINNITLLIEKYCHNCETSLYLGNISASNKKN